MSLVRWDPFRDLEDMSERLNRILQRPLLGRTADAGRERLTVPDWAPPVDIIETPEEFVLKADLPEINKEEVKVTVENGVLSIAGERKQEKEEKGKRYHRIERSYGSFLRTFTIPDNVDETKVRAEFKDGILNLRLPKTEKAKPKAIDVKVA